MIRIRFLSSPETIHSSGLYVGAPLLLKEKGLGDDTFLHVARYKS
jgi:hypothetical protein